jgi:hypothetical protein
MTLSLALYVYLLIGCGFAIAAEESEPDKWKWWSLIAFVLVWPGAIAYAIGKMPIGRK